MKLQAKFTLNFILLVVITIGVSFLLIDWSVQSQFNRFIQEKNHQWQELHRGEIFFQFNISKGLTNGKQPQSTDLLLENPFENKAGRENLTTPEQNFLKTVNNSLLWAGVIDVTFAIILAYLLSSVLLRRIYRLKGAMSQYMHDGSLKPVFHSNKDEVDDLANIYNHLIEKIEKEERIRKEFFVDMSHELRTPLTSIKGYLEGLVDNVFDVGKEKDIHEKTLQETDRMIFLVKEMTTLAKLESEKITLTTEKVDLHVLTAEVVEMFAPQLQKRNLKTDIKGELQSEVDVYKFKQVLINLLDNAFQYAQESSVIVIEMGRTKNEVFWRIKNKLAGTPPANTEYFFERFYRGDKSRTYDAKKPHLGIGLNIVKKIIEQHQGKIAARIEGNDIVFEIFFSK